MKKRSKFKPGPDAVGWIRMGLMNGIHYNHLILEYEPVGRGVYWVLSDNGEIFHAGKEFVALSSYTWFVG